MSTRWDRIEPNTTDETLLEGLQARIADPLWMLARQWQTGEFDGEDAATPLETLVDYETMPLSSLTDGTGRTRTIDRDIPLEPVVEAISPSADSAQEIGSLATIAMQMIADAGIDTNQAADVLRKLYPLDYHRYQGGVPLPASDARRLRLLARRCFDINLLLEDDGAKLREKVPALSVSWIERLRAVYSARGHAIAEATDCWQAQRLAYAGSIAASTKSVEERLELADYGGGRLDWYSFDRAAPSKEPAEAERDKPVEQQKKGLPMPLCYAGQPLSRYWEIEDGAVHFGGIAAGPADIARMIVADFASIAGDDVFVVPLEAEVGAMIRVKRLQVRDSFAEAGKPAGHCHLIPPGHVIDRQRFGAAAQDFSLFTYGGEAGQPVDSGQWVAVMAVIANAYSGKPLEKVSLRRDEEANLAWAVEEQVEGPFGKSIRRRQSWEIDPPASLVEGQAWPYRLQSAVPPWWIPLVPERIGAGAQMHLRRARLGAWDTMPAETTGPKSRLMDPRRPVTIDEDALPQGGLRLSRHWQLARGYDGRLVLWQSWRKQWGAEDRLSGLAFDAIARRW